jgi:hypothetical protein
MILKVKDWIKQKNGRSKVVQKWIDSGLLDGLKGIIKENIAKIFESQASQLLKDENRKQ